MFKKLLAVLLLALLSACGGGGGASTQNGYAEVPAANLAQAEPTAAQTAPILAFSPEAVNVTVPAGASSTAMLSAKVIDPSLSTLDIAPRTEIVDSENKILVGILLGAKDLSTLTMTLFLPPLPVPGRYQGTFQIHFCTDFTRTKRLRGSPVYLPYDILVTDNPAQQLPRP